MGSISDPIPKNEIAHIKDKKLKHLQQSQEFSLFSKTNPSLKATEKFQ